MCSFIFFIKLTNFNFRFYKKITFMKSEITLLNSYRVFKTYRCFSSGENSLSSSSKGKPKV